jgi:ABC-type lipoprotein export system ATPase subunit/bifunctional DNA-binding transcriptional regulator/antitoxin component of YhaV-PrlF toxin-antitoxin module
MDDKMTAKEMSNMPEEPFILCDNLVKIYKVAGLEVVALQGLDLIVAPGELLGIVGASGSGKSTLMNILGGLDRPSAGRVWVGGHNLLELSDAGLTQYRRSQVGFVWQQGARNLIPFLTAQENIELPMSLAGSSTKRIHERAGSLLDAVGLGDRRHHKLTMLSGGEQQRVAIAVALANEPRLILADEPTGELDTNNSITIYNAFQELNRQFGVTTLIVTHDQGISKYVNRVVAIRDGKTSSETVRIETSSDNGDQLFDETYEELVVLDSAGRLQVPKEYLEKMGIKGRARLEMKEDGIMILPALTAMNEHSAQSLAAERATRKTENRILAFFRRKKV